MRYTEYQEMLGVDMDTFEDEETDEVCRCEVCGEIIRKEENSIGFVTPAGEKIMLCGGDDLTLTDILDLLGVDYAEGDAEEVSETLDAYVENRKLGLRPAKEA